MVQEFPIEDQGEAQACASYKFRCTENEPGCAPEEIAKQDVFKWSYTAMPAAQCEQMKANADGSQFGNVTCCSNDLCNKPDPVADPDAVLMDDLMANNGTATDDGKEGEGAIRSQP